MRKTEGEQKIRVISDPTRKGTQQTQQTLNGMEPVTMTETLNFK